MSLNLPGDNDEDYFPLFLDDYDPIGLNEEQQAQLAESVGDRGGSPMNFFEDAPPMQALEEDEPLEVDVPVGELPRQAEDEEIDEFARNEARRVRNLARDRAAINRAVAAEEKREAREAARWAREQEREERAARRARGEIVGERVICPDCGRPITINNLARHQKCVGIRRSRIFQEEFAYGKYVAPPPRHHLERGLRDVPECEFCGYRPSCKRLDNLRRHIAEVHELEKDNRRAMKAAARCRDEDGEVIEDCFECRIHGNRYTGRGAHSNWIRHMKSHRVDEEVPELVPPPQEVVIDDVDQLADEIEALFA